MAACVLLALLLGPSEALPQIRLRRSASGERQLVDQFGRERFFHGTNAVVKGPPWIPSRDGFDPLTSLTAKDFELMQAAGLNLIRLGVMWPGVEPERGVYNESYLAAVRDIAREAASYGIYMLADMHQDLLSEKFCGEGIPLWAAQPEKVSFPLPLGLPFHPGPDGLPTRGDCARHSWSAFYGAVATGSAYHRLYTNYDNLTDAWGAYWAKVAQSFGNASELLGLNIINEPWAGDPYEDPALMLPAVADRKLLQPAYDVVASHIRAVAPEALIFFPGTTWDRTGLITDHLPQGFQHAPGGSESADRAVNSFHFYRPPQFLSHVESYFQTRLTDAQHLGTGLFLTETCCNFFFEQVAPVAEARGVSWLHWEWKPFCKETNATNSSTSQFAAFGACKTGDGGWPFPHGVFNVSMYRALARPYAQAIAGNFSSSGFEVEAKIFRLSFRADPSILEPTLISTPEIIYPSGIELQISPPNACKVKYVKGGLELRNVPGAVAFGETVSVQVKSKESELIV